MVSKGMTLRFNMIGSTNRAFITKNFNFAFQVTMIH
jgi:hypothetical protein